MATVELAVPDPGRNEAERFVATVLADVVGDVDDADAPRSSSRFRGGQTSADKALAELDLTSYTRQRNNAFPQRQRGATGLSPYIRHGLLDLPRLWHEVMGPPEEVSRFRLELLWQEYARHWYARLGPASKKPLRNQPVPPPVGVSPAGRPTGFPAPDPSDDGWDRSMGCVEITTGELEDEGWLVGQARLWLASQWTVRQGNDWRQGEEYFFRHLLDGSRAANRLGWQTASGIGSDRPYNFSRWQVEVRAPGLCASCDHVADCPIDRWSSNRNPTALDEPNRLLHHDPDPATTSGPAVTEQTGESADVVWLTAESMGDHDPAMAANPELPVVFVLDRPLLAKLRLSSKRLVFLVETLAELALRRELHLYLGRPGQALASNRVATTFAPVPGWRRHVHSIRPVQVHPWTWLHRPVEGDISTFNRWFEQLSGGPLDQKALTEAIGALPVISKDELI